MKFDIDYIEGVSLVFQNSHVTMCSGISGTEIIGLEYLGKDLYKSEHGLIGQMLGDDNKVFTTFDNLEHPDAVVTKIELKEGVFDVATTIVGNKAFFEVEGGDVREMYINHLLKLASVGVYQPYVDEVLGQSNAFKGVEYNHTIKDLLGLWNVLLMHKQYTTIEMEGETLVVDKGLSTEVRIEDNPLSTNVFDALDKIPDAEPVPAESPLIEIDLDRTPTGEEQEIEDTEN